MENPALQTELEALFRKARDELELSRGEGDQRCITALERLLRALQAGECEEVFRAASGSKCCCGRSASLIEACQDGCARCALQMLWQVGRRDASFYEATALLTAASAGSLLCVWLTFPFERGLFDSEGAGAVDYTVLGDGTCLDKRACLRVIFQDKSEFVPFEGDPVVMGSLLGSISLVEENIDRIRQSRRSKWTALMAAASLGYDSIVKLLLKSQAWTYPSKQQTALMCAAVSGAEGCIRLLLKKEAQLVDFQNRTALMRAASVGWLESVRLLVSKEGGFQDYEGDTALMFAAQRGWLECCRELCKKEAGLTNKKCDTALIVAAKGNHTECCRLLARKEARRPGRYGETALFGALQNGHQEAALLLIPYEAEITKSALHLAAGQGMQRCLEAMLCYPETHSQAQNALCQSVVRLDTRCIELSLSVCAAEIPAALILAYRGDVAGMLRTREQSELKVGYAGILDFAVAGRHPLAVRAVMVFQKCCVLRAHPYLSSPEHLEFIRLSLPAFIRSFDGSNELLACVQKKNDNVSRLLYPYFLASMAGPFKWRAKSCRSPEAFRELFRWVRYVGGAYDSVSALEERADFGVGLWWALQENPLWAQQIRQLRGFLERHTKELQASLRKEYRITQDHHPFLRQAVSETQFNVWILLAARNVQCRTESRRDQTAFVGKPYRQRILLALERRALLLRGMQAQLVHAVTEMLNE